MTHELQNKTAIIYGAGGHIGSATAKAYAREGATVYLAGRTLKTLEAVADDITAAGGTAHAVAVDALDAAAVTAFTDSVGRIDISLNLVSRGDHFGPILDTSAEDFTRALTVGLTSTFNTATAAARQMVQQGSGVILSLTSASSQANAPTMGAVGTADAATETFLRYLATENGPQGVRVVGLWTAGIPETFVPPLPSEAAAGMAQMTMLHRLPSLAQVIDSLTFLASDRAAGITGTHLNVTCGMVVS